MDKTTTLKLNKPANGDYTGRWDVPLNENFDLVDAEITASRTELTGQSAVDISTYLKGSTASLAARLDAGLNNDGTIKFNDDDLEKSRYSGLETRATDPYDDIHKRLEALEGRQLIGDSVDDMSGYCSRQVKRVTSGASGFDFGSFGTAVSSNLRYQDNLNLTIVGTTVEITANLDDQEFVIGGKLYELKLGRKVVVETTTLPKGILYAQGWYGTGAASGGNPAGGQIDAGTGSATISTNTWTVATSTGTTSDVLDGDVLLVTDGATSVKYRYKISAFNAGNIEIHGLFPRAFTAGTVFSVLRMAEPKFYFVDTSGSGSIAQTGDIYKYINNDRGNTTVNQFDRQAIAYCDGTTFSLLPPRISMGNTEIVMGGIGTDWVGGMQSVAVPAPPTVGGLPAQVKAIIPFLIGTAAGGDGTMVWNPCMVVPVINQDYTAYTIGMFSSIFSTSLMFASGSDHTFDSLGTIYVNCMDVKLDSGSTPAYIHAQCGNGDYLNVLSASTLWGVAIIY